MRDVFLQLLVDDLSQSKVLYASQFNELFFHFLFMRVWSSCVFVPFGYVKVQSLSIRLQYLVQVNNVAYINDI